MNKWVDECQRNVYSFKNFLIKVFFEKQKPMRRQK